MTVSRHKDLSVILIAVFGISLSVTAYLFTRQQEQLVEQIRFKEQVSEHVVLLEREINTIQIVLRSLGGLFIASKDVEFDEFNKFTYPIISRLTEFQALEWIPRVPAAERQIFEDRIKAAGYPDFRITERQKGIMVPASSARNNYFPVYFIEPLSGNESAHGFDLASSPARLKALEKARDSGEQVATERITLIQETEDQFGFLIFHPVYQANRPISTIDDRKENLLGFALGVFRIKNIVEKALRLSGHNNIHELFVFDTSASPGSQLLYPKEAGLSVPGDVRATGCIESPLYIAKRSWLVVSCKVADKVYASTLQLSWVVLLGALLISGLLTIYMRALINQKKKTEMAVEVRTHELREAQTELVKRERLATLGRLASMVSHELRNPLGAISAGAYVLRKSISSPDARINNSLDRIFRNIERCDHIIDEMLDFIRGNRPDLKPLELVSWLKALFEDQQLPEDIILKQEYPSGDCSIPADPERLRRALINVIDNACQAMLELDDIDEKILTVSASRTDDRFEIVIRDTGPGIKPEYLSQIFEPLFSTKSFGVGLGMSIVQDIMRQHNGGVEVESTMGRGTKVCLWLELPKRP